MQFLAVQTISGPRQSREAFRSDRLLAVEAYSKLAVIDALKRSVDLRQVLSLAFQPAGGEFPLTCELHRFDLFVGLDNPKVLTPARLTRDLLALTHE
jgi:hypothetical protein